MKTLRNARFERGSGCFNCGSCGRKTRNTGDNAGCGLCPECYEIGGLENTVSDNGADSKEGKWAVEEIKRLKAIVRQKGGKGGYAGDEPKPEPKMETAKNKPVVPHTPPPVTSIAVYDFDSLTNSPLASTATTVHNVRMLYANVSKPEFKNDTGRTEVWIPKAWDILEVRVEPLNFRVWVKSSIR